MIMGDLVWMHGIVGEFYSMPPAADIDGILDWVRDDPRRWALAVQLGRRIAAKETRNIGTVES